MEGSDEFSPGFLENSPFLLLTADARHWRLLEETLKDLTHPSGNLFFDIRTAVLMREHGIREIYTIDTDFLQFPGIKVINPPIQTGATLTVALPGYNHFKKTGDLRELIPEDPLELCL